MLVTARHVVRSKKWLGQKLVLLLSSSGGWNTFCSTSARARSTSRKSSGNPRGNACRPRRRTRQTRRGRAPVVIPPLRTNDFLRPMLQIQAGVAGRSSSSTHTWDRITREFASDHLGHPAARPCRARDVARCRTIPALRNIQQARDCLFCVTHPKADLEGTGRRRSAVGGGRPRNRGGDWPPGLR